MSTDIDIPDSDVSIGDVEVPDLTVDPHDADTAVTLTVTLPDGTLLDPAPNATTTDNGATWHTEPVRYTQAGAWILTWTVTGTGAGTAVRRVMVAASPTAGGPTWTPGRSRVAHYVPGRTLDYDAETHVLTFTSTTRPTGLQVDQLIADAVAWVLAATGTVAASLYDMASATAAVRAAAFVELGYPDKAEDVSHGQILLAEAQRMLDQLVRANQAATGANPTDPGAALLPRFAFPAAPSWADTDL